MRDKRVTLARTTVVAKVRCYLTLVMHTGNDWKFGTSPNPRDGSVCQCSESKCKDEEVQLHRCSDWCGGGDVFSMRAFTMGFSY